MEVVDADRGPRPPSGRTRRSRRRPCRPSRRRRPATSCSRSGLWSRPLPPWLFGVRPNSLHQTTSVSFSRPRCFRSFSSAAIGWSTWPHIFSWLRVDVVVRVPLRDERAAAASRPARSARRARPAAGRAAAACRSRPSPCRRGRRPSRRLRLLRQIDRLRGVLLHPEGEFVAGDAGLEFGVAGVERSARSACCTRSNVPLVLLGADVGRRLQVEDRARPLAQAACPGRRPAGSRPPARRAALGHAFRLRHHAVRRQVLAHAAEAVGHPRAEAREAHERAAAVQLVHRRGVDRATCTSTTAWCVLRLPCRNRRRAEPAKLHR